MDMMYEYTVTCGKKALCWFNLLSDFKIKKDLGNNKYQVFFRCILNEDEFEAEYGSLLDWT